MRRTLLLTSASLLALATGVALVVAIRSVASPVGSLRTSSDADTASVQRFYQALNNALLVGRTPTFDGLVDPALLYPNGGTAPAADRGSFQSTLQTITSSLVGFELTVEGLTGGGGEVVAFVGVRDGSRGGFPDLVSDGATPSWRFVDRFRLVEGVIVAFDHWDPGRQFATARPSADVVLARLPGAPAAIEMNRATLPPGAHLAALFGPGPEMLVVEAGTVTVRVAGSAQVSRSGGSALLEGDIDLVPGELVVVPTGTPFSIENSGQVSAVLLEVAMRSTVERSPENDGLDASALSAASPAGAIAVQPLAAGTAAEMPAGPATVAVTVLTLAPDAEVAGHEFAGAELLAVQSGRLDLTVSVGTGHLRRAGGVDVLAAPDSPAFGSEALGQTGFLAAGESAFLPLGAGYRLHNPETVPLVMVVARVVPIGADAP
jgi:mannose-6-phosphate isomerase-like protein (cupin superfamily)